MKHLQKKSVHYLKLLCAFKFKECFWRGGGYFMKFGVTNLYSVDYYVMT